MTMLEAYEMPLLGGALIGVAASLLLLVHGRIAGIAGLFAGVFLPAHDARSTRAAFVAGLCAAGVVLAGIYPEAFSMERTPALPVVALGGLLVGYGTRLGGGCTSGHGVCGMSRFSKRSIVATLVFMGAGIVTVFVVGRVFGARP
jgi:uncharacterized protein